MLPSNTAQIIISLNIFPLLSATKKLQYRTITKYTHENLRTNRLWHSTSNIFKSTRDYFSLIFRFNVEEYEQVLNHVYLHVIILSLVVHLYDQSHDAKKDILKNNIMSGKSLWHFHRFSACFSSIIIKRDLEWKSQTRQKATFLLLSSIYPLFMFQCWIENAV